MVFGSGMGAISTLMFCFLRPGDHAVFQADLYGGTLHFVTDELTKFGVEISYCRQQAEFEAATRANTRLIYVESPSNPILRCVDLRAIAQLARSQGVLSVIDNTFATPINQNPISLGIDVVVHSATKYLNGHSDVNSGVIVSSRKMIEELTGYAINHGATLDAHACYQLERGLKTLALRVDRQNRNASRLAAFLKAHAGVVRVNYPGLPDHPDHAIAAWQMRGFGGMLSFELRRPESLDNVIAGFQVVTPAVSLGGVETLIGAPGRTSHRLVSADELNALGIGLGLLRVSVGIEDIEDLEEDFDRALKNA